MEMNFEIDSSVVNPQELLKRVRENILKIQEEAEPEPEPTQFSEANLVVSSEKLRRIEEDLNIMMENIQIMNRTWHHADAPLHTRFTFLRPIVIFVKRAIRKTIYWFTQPYVEQQNDFNGAVTRAVSDSLRVQRELLESLKQH